MIGRVILQIVLLLTVIGRGIYIFQEQDEELKQFQLTISAVLVFALVLSIPQTILSLMKLICSSSDNKIVIKLSTYSLLLISALNLILIYLRPQSQEDLSSYIISQIAIEQLILLNIREEISNDLTLKGVNTEKFKKPFLIQVSIQILAQLFILGFIYSNLRLVYDWVLFNAFLLFRASRIIDMLEQKQRDRKVTFELTQKNSPESKDMKKCLLEQSPELKYHHRPSKGSSLRQINLNEIQLEQKEGEVEIGEQIKFSFDQILSHFPYGVIIVDQKGKLKYHNDSVLKIFNIFDPKQFNIESILQGTSIHLEHEQSTTLLRDEQSNKKRSKSDNNLLKKSKYQNQANKFDLNNEYSRRALPQISSSGQIQFDEDFVQQKANQNNLSLFDIIKGQNNETNRGLQKKSTFSQQLNQAERIKVSVLEGKYNRLRLKIIMINQTYTIGLKIHQQYLIFIQNFSNFELQNYNTERQNFMSQILNSFSHELRTPLNNSISKLSACMENEDLDEDFKEFYINSSLKSNQLLLNQIDDIIDYIQIESGSLAMNFSFFNIQTEIQNCLSFFASEAQQKNLRIIVKISEETPNEIWNDAGRFRQVLINLLSNAFQFTQKGQITIEAQPVQERFIKVSVIDTGCGISFQNLDQIFQSLDNVANMDDSVGYSAINSQGIGLGLTISQKIAMMLSLNKCIEVSSLQEIGSTFSFYIFNHFVVQGRRGIQFYKQQCFDRTIFQIRSLTQALSQVSMTNKSVRTKTFLDPSMLNRSLTSNFSPQNNIYLEDVLQEEERVPNDGTLNIDIYLNQLTRNIFSNNIKDQTDEVASSSKDKVSPFYGSEQSINSLSQQDQILLDHKGSSELHTNNNGVVGVDPDINSRVSQRQSFKIDSPERKSLSNDKFLNFSVISDDVAELDDAFKSVSNFINDQEKSRFSSRKGSRDTLMKKFGSPKQKQCGCVHILVVDDNQFNLEAIAMVLEQLGYKTDQANSGAKAIKMVQQQYYEETKSDDHYCPFYNLVFMDIDMPNQDGFQTTREIMEFLRTLNLLQIKTIVCCCSAFGDEDSKQKAKAAGMQYFIQKPIDNDTVKDITDRIFNQVRKCNTNISKMSIGSQNSGTIQL